MHRRVGLTLTELMVAMALTGVLAAAALRVAGGLLRSSKPGRNASQRSVVENDLRSVLALDIAHAERYRPDKAGLYVKTRSRLSSDTLELRHLPTRVSYSVRKVGERHWLIRTQHGASGEQRTDLVCSGVRSVRMVERPAGPGPVMGQWKTLDPEAAVRVAFEGDRPDLQLRWHREGP